MIAPIRTYLAAGILALVAPAASAQAIGVWQPVERDVDGLFVAQATCSQFMQVVSCMQFTCGSLQNPFGLGLVFTNLGFVPDTVDAPAGPESTDLRWTFHDGTAFVMGARRHQPEGADNNVVEGFGWDGGGITDVLENDWADAGPDDLAVISLPDGRISPFALEGMAAALDAARETCEGQQ